MLGSGLCQEYLGVIESETDCYSFACCGLGHQQVDVLGRDSLGVCGAVEVYLLYLSGVVPLHQRVDGSRSDRVGRYREAADPSEGLDDPDDERHRVELVGGIYEDAFSLPGRDGNVVAYDLDLGRLQLLE